MNEINNIQNESNDIGFLEKKLGIQKFILKIDKGFKLFIKSPFLVEKK